MPKKNTKKDIPLEDQQIISKYDTTTPIKPKLQNLKQFQLVPPVAKSDYAKGQSILHAKNCQFCRPVHQKLEAANIPLLVKYLTPSGHIVPRRMTGNCAKHQRKVSRVIKRAKSLGLFSYKKGFEVHNPSPFEDYVAVNFFENKKLFLFELGDMGRLAEETRRLNEENEEEEEEDEELFKNAGVRDEVYEDEDEEGEVGSGSDEKPKE